MAEGARLESVYTETYRGFESLSLRQFIKMGKFNYPILKKQRIVLLLIYGLLTIQNSTTCDLFAG